MIIEVIIAKNESPENIEKSDPSEMPLDVSIVDKKIVVSIGLAEFKAYFLDEWACYNFAHVDFNDFLIDLSVEILERQAMEKDSFELFLCDAAANVFQKKILAISDLGFDEEIPF